MIKIYIVTKIYEVYMVDHKDVTRAEKCDRIS